MNRQEYRAILGRLSIENPTPEDMGQLCPHLTREQAVEAFNGELSYVACPSLRIRGAFQIVSLHREWVEEIKVWRGDAQVVTGTKVHPPQLCHAFAGRTLRSYADGKFRGDLFNEYQYMAEAMKFAEDNWGDELIFDTWEDVIQFYVQDPTDLYQEGYSKGSPKTKAVLSVCLNRAWNDLINDHTKPTTELIDDAIVEVTLDMAVWDEFKGGRGGYTDFNCAYCGYGLHLSGCNGCGHRFRDNHFRSGWDTPLSRRLVKFLQENGHVFGKDPEIALQTEAFLHGVREQGFLRPIGK